MFEDYTLLNKWSLAYKSRQLARLYIEERKVIHKQLFLLMGICGCILQVFFAFFNNYKIKSNDHMLISIGYAIYWIVIIILGTQYTFTIKYSLLLYCVAQTLYLSHSYLDAIHEYLQELEPQQAFVCIFIYALIYITHISVATHPINSFLMRMFSLNFACIYFCCSLVIKQDRSFNLLWIGALICLACVDFVNYSEERSSKIQFVEKYKQKKQLEGWKTLLDESFPVGVVIAKKSMKEQKLNVIFSNQTCHDIFNNQQNEYIEKQLQLIQMDFSKSKQNGGTDHRMENHVFIGDCTKQCLSEEIIQYFNLNRKERKMSIVQQGKPYCSFGYYLNDKQEKNHFNIIANNIAWENESCFLIILKDVSQKMMYDRLYEIDQYKDQLLASVTHELKTPLNGILTIVQAAEQEEDSCEIKKQLQLIKKSGCMLEIILNDILDYSRLQKQKLRLIIKKFDIVNTIDDVINIVQIQFSKSEIQIIKDIQIDDTSILSDSNRLKQIIFNLMTNAIKFTERGEIRIIVKKSSAQCLSITVQDTGVGIPENLQKKLFKLYGTFDHSNGSNRHGVGLGLVITKNLVELLGPSNYIELESKVGQGSTFTFEIYNHLEQEDNSLADLIEGEGDEDLVVSNDLVQCFDPTPNNITNLTNSHNLHLNCNSGANIFNNIVLGLECSPPINNTNSSNSNNNNNNNNIHNTTNNNNNNTNPNNKTIQQLITKFESDVTNFISSESSPQKTDMNTMYTEIERMQLTDQHLPQGAISKNLFSQQNAQQRRKYIYRKSSAQNYSTPQNKSLAQHPPQFNCDVHKRHRNSFFIPHKVDNYIGVPDQKITFNTPQFQRNSAQYSDTSLMLSSIQPLNCEDKQETYQKLACSQNQFTSPNHSPSPKRSYASSILNQKYKSSKSFHDGSPSPSTALFKKKLSQRCSFDIESTNLPSKSSSEYNVFDIIFKTRTKILIVDDTYLNITALKLILGKSQNLVIDEAFHGQQAIEKIEESEKLKDPFQLVFMDMNMPVMDGVQAIIIIRQKIKDGLLSDLKIAVCSAFGDLSSKMKCIKAGADLHIAKPINKSEMEQQLMQIYNISLESQS